MKLNLEAVQAALAAFQLSAGHPKVTGYFVNVERDLATLVVEIVPGLQFRVKIDGTLLREAGGYAVPEVPTKPLSPASGETIDRMLEYRSALRSIYSEARDEVQRGNRDLFVSAVLRLCMNALHVKLPEIK